MSSLFSNLRGEQREGAEAYYDSMKRLTSNDKNVINSLTEIAHENRSQAKIIVYVIEKRISMAPSDHLLPHLYLLDSICKNHGNPFTELFQLNLINTFIHVFHKVNEKVRTSMYKLRYTWTAANLFKPATLQELDRRIHEIDPAWPILKSYAPPPTQHGGGSHKILINPTQPSQHGGSHKILINPAKFPQSAGPKLRVPEPVLRIEEETELMRTELLRKEKELLELKRKDIDQQLQGLKMQQQIKNNSLDGTASTPDDAKVSTKKVSSSSSSESRDPRKRRKPESEKHESVPSEPSSSKSDTKSTSRSESRHKDRSPSRKSARSEKSNGSSHSSSSSKRSSKSEDKKKSSPKKEEKKEKKREPSPKFSRSPTPVVDGRISPLPPPPSNKIPKLRKGAEEKREEKRAEKRASEDGKRTPPPEKRPRPVNIDLVEDSSVRDTSSPAVGWAKHKESNPDKFRTPNKEMGPFFQDQGPPGPWMEDRGRGRGFRGFRGHRNNWGGGRGRFNDFPRFPHQQGFMGPMFGFQHRGGMGPPFRPGFRMPPGLPGLHGPDITKTDPVIIRKEVIPNLMKLGQECKEKGTIDEGQFREFMNQVMQLKETSLNREAEMRQNRDVELRQNQENKENRFQRRGVHGFPSAGDRLNGADDRIEDKKIPHVDGAQNRPRPDIISPHKNDLPLANPTELEEVKKDPTRTLNIDDIPRAIRYYGETATIAMDDNCICELAFKPERERRRVMVDNISVYCEINTDRYTKFMLNGKPHKLRIGNPTRELWIDNEWYECYFNSKIRIKIDNDYHYIFLPGPPPSVDIGKVRHDLCRGRVYALLDGNLDSRTPLYLDSKPQLLIIGYKPHVLRFVEGFKTLTINGHPFRTDFGGFPMVISVNGFKHYVRLTSFPTGSWDEDKQCFRPISPRIDERLSPVGSPKDDVGLHSQDPLNQMMSVLPSSSKSNRSDTPNNYGTSPGVTGPPPNLTSTPTHPPPSLPAALLAPPPALNSTPAVVDVPARQPAVPEAIVAPPIVDAPPPDINDLWAKLQSSGVLSLFGTGGVGSAAGIPGLAVQQEPERTAESPISFPNAPTRKVRRNSVGMKEIQLKSHDPSLKERHQYVIDSLFGLSDLQCKSCGLRFNSEEMGFYSSHLDWHFRLKRRERDNARKAQSRRWYYEKNDWIVSDEIEDDEHDMTEEDIILEQSMEIPTVAARGAGNQEGGEETCPVCTEVFSQVYRQEGEEEGSWQLHNAMRDDLGVAYHPECYKDKEAQEKRALENPRDSTPEHDESMEVEDEVKVDLGEVKMEVHEENVEVKTEPLTQPQDEDVEMTEVKPEPGSEVKTEVLEELMPKPKVEPVDSEPMKSGEEHLESGVESTGAGAELSETEAETGGAETKPEKVDLDLSMSSNLENKPPVPVSIPKPKVEIKVSLTTNIVKEGKIERSESLSEDLEDSEFDPEAIIVPALTQEAKDLAKPKLKGRGLVNYPPNMKDKDMSGLCSIM